MEKNSARGSVPLPKLWKLGNVEQMFLPKGASVYRNMGFFSVCFLPRDGNTNTMQAVWIKWNIGHYSTIQEFPGTERSSLGEIRYGGKCLGGFETPKADFLC